MKMSIRQKILVIPIVAILGFIIYLGVNYNANSANSIRLQKIKEVYFPVLELANANIVRLDRIGEMLNTAVTTGEMETVKATAKTKQDILEALHKQRTLQAERADEINSMEAALLKYYDKAVALSQGMVDGTADMAKISDKVEAKNTALQEISEDMRNFRDASDQSFIDTVKAADATATSTLQLGLVVGGITVVILLFVSVSIVSSVTKSLGAVSNSLQDIAQGQGDLTQRIEQRSNDEIGELVYWFNVFVEKLHGTIGEVVTVIRPLTDVSADLKNVSQETEKLSSAQSASASHVSEAMMDMLSSVNAVAAHAESAAEAAKDADEESQRGKKVVNDTVNSINDLAAEVERAGGVIIKLEKDAENVGSILDVIKAIAEQTNLLALNAAIEAARAGEQGRGFAVVADEVRTLASRTQESTQQIQEVIEQLQSAAQQAVKVMQAGQGQARSSVQQAAKTGDSLQAITGKVASISDMNRQIAAATVQQQNTSKSIQSNVIRMRDASQSAVASTLKVKDLSTALDELAQKLSAVSRQFKV